MTLLEGFVKDEIFIDFGADVLYGSDQCYVNYPCRFPTVGFQLMATNGLTVITDTLIEKPHSFSTACNIATQIIAQVASNTYGGQTISLAHLAPFVDVSRQKYKSEIKDEFLAIGRDYTDSEINRMAEMRVRREVQRGIQTIQYQIQTLLTTNGQTPFVSVFMYLDEVEPGQTRDDLALIIAETLKQRYRKENSTNFNNAIQRFFPIQRKRPNGESGGPTTMLIGCQFLEKENGEPEEENAAFS